MSLPEKPSAMASQIGIREFQPGDEAVFRGLNEEWIVRYFHPEPKDEQIFANPRGTVLEQGGKIFFATVDGQCVGCCALLRMNEEEFEVAKMAVTSAYQGGGIGRRLLNAVIEAGRSARARRLYLETNHALKSAIRLYESMGFTHLPPGRIPFSAYSRADVYMELILA